MPAKKGDSNNNNNVYHVRQSAAEEPGMRIITSNRKLENAFNWAREKALSYVQTGKSGPVDKHERSEGTGTERYITCFWAGYTSRTAFYSRDFCHQAAGAHLLGLQLENLTMLRAFAESSNEGREWFPLWAINFDGSTFKLDYHNDGYFVREVPAVFELVEQCYRQYLWTGNREYLYDSAIWKFCSKAVTDFVELHDTRIPNGVAEGDGSGDIFRGSATYNEIKSPLVEAGDGIACQYQALSAYSNMSALKGDAERARLFARKAEQLKSFFNREWGVKENAREYVRGYDVDGQVLTDFGLENSWFIPMKFISEPSEKNTAYLDFIAESVESAEGRPTNLEAISYLPGVFFPYNRAEGWKWLEYIIDQPDKEYPEISYAIIGDIIEHMIGFTPDAPTSGFATVSRLPEAVEILGVENIPLGKHRVNVTHEGTSKTKATHASGSEPLNWEARFYGEHSRILVNGRKTASQMKKLNGVTVSFVIVQIPAGETATSEIRP